MADLLQSDHIDDSQPGRHHALDGYRLFSVELTKLTRAALRDLGLDAKSMDRCKNFFALGMCYWLYNRSMDGTYKWLDEKFSSKPVLAEANKLAMKAGHMYCDVTEAFQTSYEIPPAKLSPGVYRNISGNTALALGFVAASQKAVVPPLPATTWRSSAFTARLVRPPANQVKLDPSRGSKARSGRRVQSSRPACSSQNVSGSSSERRYSSS